MATGAVNLQRGRDDGPGVLLGTILPLLGLTLLVGGPRWILVTSLPGSTAGTRSSRIRWPVTVAVIEDQRPKQPLHMARSAPGLHRQSSGTGEAVGLPR